MKELRTNYGWLLENFKAVSIIQSATDIVRWDMETYMPPKGITLRSEELALLSEIEYQRVTDPKVGILLETLEKEGGNQNLDLLQKRNVAIIRKNYEEQVKIPQKLVSEIAKHEALVTDIWKKAKAGKNFSMFAPELESLVDLKREYAEILQDVKKTETSYDALIDIYEPKITARTITGIFNKLKRGVRSLIEKCQRSKKQPDVSVLQRKVPIPLQKKISQTLAEFVKYDTASKKAGGRIDETEHPFTSGYYNDVRITTHYYENNVTSSIFSVLHESGHALYEQNLNSKWMYQPIGAICSHGIHESQSRFVENIVGRSPEFWRFFLPKLKRATGNLFSDSGLDDFVFAINKVKPSKIRIEADEVTYCLHIIIRFEIERDLMAHRISVKDLPHVWNQKYREYLDVNIEQDSEGVLQDTHWASGAIGYFPSYALGNIYSGQMLSKMQKDLPDWKDHVIHGDFQSVKLWLRKNVYQYGKLYDPEDLIKKLPGKK
ncbi:MAG: carboxypeptidase M32 [Candidatus Bathyarchaeota archaeon]